MNTIKGPCYYYYTLHFYIGEVLPCLPTNEQKTDLGAPRATPDSGEVTDVPYWD